MREYAVLIPIVKTENEDAMLLEVRSEKVRQPGEVCFPGGRVEPGETPRETAVRETCEELGVGPAAIGELTELAEHRMSDGRIVHPFTADLSIDGIGGLRLSENEVAEVFLLPFSWLEANEPAYFELSETEDGMLPAKLKEYLSHYGEYRRSGTTDYWEYEGHGIWGLTARIIRTVTRR